MPLKAGIQLQREHCHHCREISERVIVGILDAASSTRIV